MAKYRILTFSNNLFVVHTKWLFFWISESEQFETLADAKSYVENLKILATKPKLVDISYID